MVSSKRKIFCDYPNCTKYAKRWPDLKRHQEEIHQPPKTCPVPDCDYSVKRRRRMRAHLEAKHGYRREDAIEMVEEHWDSFNSQDQVLDASESVNDSNDNRTALAMEKKYLSSNCQNRMAQQAFSGTRPNCMRTTKQNFDESNMESLESSDLLLFQDVAPGVAGYLPSSSGTINCAPALAQPNPNHHDNLFALTSTEIHMFCNEYEDEWWIT